MDPEPMLQPLSQEPEFGLVLQETENANQDATVTCNMQPSSPSKQESMDSPQQNGRRHGAEGRAGLFWAFWERGRRPERELEGGREINCNHGRPR